jgi:hypothetical protein
LIKKIWGQKIAISTTVPILVKFPCTLVCLEKKNLLKSQGATENFIARFNIALMGKRKFLKSCPFVN